MRCRIHLQIFNDSLSKKYSENLSRLESKLERSVPLVYEAVQNHNGLSLHDLLTTNDWFNILFASTMLSHESLADTN
jgi:hypothetical protein